MQKITVDASLLDQLKRADAQVEVCDEAGRAVGFFLPPELHHELLYAWAKAQFTDEELATARAERKTNPGYSNAEAIAYLERLSGSSEGR